MSPSPASPVTERERLDRLRLLRSENVGPATFAALLRRYASATEALEALPELSARGGLRRGIHICSIEQAEAELDAARRLGARLVGIGDPDYPPLLAHADGAPPLIYVSGNPSVLTRATVAIVGSRNCSAAGQRIARTMAGELAAAGIVVVSGLARGVDAAAHRGSLSTGTVAVLAGGHGHLYPPENVGLAAEIAVSGALVSEMPPDWNPRGRDFPRRNRIISGMARGVVVIEAAMRSGSLITARLAAEQGREVFAVPGSPLDPRAEGTNRLIRHGATLTRSAADVLESLGETWPSHRHSHAPAANEPESSPVTPEDAGQDGRALVLDALGPAPVEIDDLIRRTGLPAAAIMLSLVELELAGRLERHPGQRVSLASG